jgi:outer membrane lipoprotein carrier protein
MRARAGAALAAVALLASSAFAQPSAVPSAEPSPVPVPSLSLSPLPNPSPEPSPPPRPKPKPKPKPKKKKHSNLPLLLQEVEDKYEAAGTLVAEFSQIEFQAALNRTKKTSGTIQAKRPGKLHWETKSPDASLLVSDGQTFWFYTPPFDEGEKGQLIERKSSQVQSRLAHALLQGSFSMMRDMKVHQEGPSSYVLVPKKGTAGTVKQAEIQIDPATKLITKVTLEHEGGNRSEISLSKIELGKPLADELFVFKAPEGTEIINP